MAFYLPINMRLTALHVDVCMAQHLSLSAHSCRSRPPQVAAVQPVIADIRASYSIMSAGTSVCGQCGS